MVRFLYIIGESRNEMSIIIIIINLNSTSGKRSQSLNSPEDEVCRVYELIREIIITIARYASSS